MQNIKSRTIFSEDNVLFSILATNDGGNEVKHLVVLE